MASYELATNGRVEVAGVQDPNTSEIILLAESCSPPVDLDGESEVALSLTASHVNFPAGEFMSVFVERSNDLGVWWIDPGDPVLSITEVGPQAAQLSGVAERYLRLHYVIASLALLPGGGKAPPTVGAYVVFDATVSTP